MGRLLRNSFFNADICYLGCLLLLLASKQLVTRHLNRLIGNGDLTLLPEKGHLVEMAHIRASNLEPLLELLLFRLQICFLLF